MNLINYFFDSFNTYRDKVAFNYPIKKEEVSEWQSLTYGDVENYSLKIFSFLKNIISPGDKVILFAENSPWWCISYIGIILNGAIAVPLDMEVDEETVKKIIIDSEAKFILYSEKTSDKVAEFKGFNIERIRDLQNAVETSFVNVQNEAPASLIYTSGTTGNPKAVLLTHSNFIFQIEAIRKTNIIKSDEHILSILPLHHTYPFVCSFLVPFCLGATITFLPQIRGEVILNTIKSMKITAMIAVPKILELFRGKILEKIKKLPIPLSWFLLGIKRLCSYIRRQFDINVGKFLFFFIHLKTGSQFRFFTSGGARLDPEVMKDMEALGFTVIEGYGLTETSPVVSFNPKSKRKPGSAGKALEGVSVIILNPDHDGIGEIAVKGPLVMRGYYKNEELTKESFQNDYFITGDLGYLDKEGYLYITGRKKDIIILSSGKTVYPEDVEESYKKRIPLIKEICLLDNMEAIIVPDINYARQKGIVNISSNLKWELDAASRTIPSHMRIKGFHLYNDELPKTRLGKFRRFLIKEMIYQGQKEKEQEVIPEIFTETGKIVVEIIKSIIPSIKSIKKSDHLELDLGMDSLNRIELVLSLEKRFSIALTDNIINKWTTVEDIIIDIDKLKNNISFKKIAHKKPRGKIFKLTRLSILMPAHFLLRFFFKLFFRLKVYGLNNLPNPPFILAPNHISYFDGFVIFASLPFKISKNLYFQGLKKFFPNKFIAELINVIPISSDSDLISAMESSKEILKIGGSLCIFPEGGRSFDGKLREFQKGFAILSIETKVPVVPAIINGTFEALPRGKIIPKISRISVFIDSPLNAPNTLTDTEKFKEEVRNKMINIQKIITKTYE